MKGVARQESEVARVRQLLQVGLSDYEISRRTGIPRSTVLKWRHGPSAVRSRHTDHSNWRPEDAVAYCYALGLYLGDGHIVVRNSRPSFFRLYLDAKYPSLIDEAAGTPAGFHGPGPPLRLGEG